ncbi:hypothetical protein ACPOL_5964 [Acidisarcina polymorpha]|uniref:Uncharacterized protein n=1 Tax=Acidisarcina polymorpha TaxID=2211140 RepID=A0A2Z5G8C5_9BACT|nr:hypothetical protein ACPOL_5964 [Acidisarcina polymorpha]
MTPAGGADRAAANYPLLSRYRRLTGLVIELIHRERDEVRCSREFRRSAVPIQQHEGQEPKAEDSPADDPKP